MGRDLRGYDEDGRIVINYAKFDWVHVTSVTAEAQLEGGFCAR